MRDADNAGDPIGDLVALLSRLPGIGERTAGRLAHFVLATDSAYAVALGDALTTLHARVHRCVECGNFGPSELCRICTDPRRDPTQLCVVARVPDLLAIERSSLYRGRYHVLHALLAPLDGMAADKVDVDGLAARVTRLGVREVVLATPLSVEGEATALYVASSLRKLMVEGEPLRLSRIASGIPHGGELEYADQVTLGRALDGRKGL